MRAIDISLHLPVTGMPTRGELEVNARASIKKCLPSVGSLSAADNVFPHMAECHKWAIAIQKSLNHWSWMMTMSIEDGHIFSTHQCEKPLNIPPKLKPRHLTPSF